MTRLEHCTKAVWRLAKTSLLMRGRSNDTVGTLNERLSGDWHEQVCSCEAVGMTQLKHCTRALWRFARTGLFMRGHGNDIARGPSGDWQEQACECEAMAMTHLEHCTKRFLVIGKNRFDSAKP